MPTYSPVLIDSSTFGNAAINICQFVYANNLYAFLNIFTGGVASMGAFQSGDGGATWVELDATNRPTALNSRYAFYDGVATVIVGMNLSGAQPQPLQFMNFNLAAGTWGPVYGMAGAPSTSAIAGEGGVFKRPDGKIVVVSSPRQGTATPNHAGPPSGFQIDVYDTGGGTWAASIDAGTNITGLAGWDPTTILLNMDQATGVMDSTGQITVVLNTTSLAAGWGNRVFIQQFTILNTLGAFFDVPGQEVPYATPPNAGHQALEAFSGTPFGPPIIDTVADTIILPVLATNRTNTFPRQFAALYLGTPVANPVWSIDLTKTIDPDVFLGIDEPFPEEAPSIAMDGSVMYAVFTAQDDTGFIDYGRLRLCASTNLASPADGWSAITAFNLATDSPPGFNFAGQECLLPSVRLTGSPTQVMVTMDALVPPAGPTEARYWMGNFSPGAPLAIICNNPPDGNPSIPYSHPFPASGGTAPYAFSISAGALPPFLSIDPLTGIVSGLPAALGTFNFTVQVTDSAAGLASVACSITIVPGDTQLVKITLRGVKRRRIEPGEDPQLVDVPNLPSVKRAM